MQEFSNYLRSTSSELSLREVLQQPVSALLGVSDDAVAALGGIGLTSVFDLGSLLLFAQAAAAVSASTSVLGSLSTDVLTDAAAATPLADVPDLPLENMRSLTAAKAAALKTALDTDTIREFALWPQRQIAETMVSSAAGTNLELDEEAQAEELRPRFGEYPTERVYYDSLVMLKPRRTRVWRRWISSFARADCQRGDRIWKAGGGGARDTFSVVVCPGHHARTDAAFSGVGAW